MINGTSIFLLVLTYLHRSHSLMTLETRMAPAQFVQPTPPVRMVAKSIAKPAETVVSGSIKIP